jgi:hypothetical protein
MHVFVYLERLKMTQIGQLLIRTLNVNRIDF